MLSIHQAAAIAQEWHDKQRARDGRARMNGNAEPRTRIVAHVPPGKAAWPHNVERYELKDND